MGHIFASHVFIAVAVTSTLVASVTATERYQHQMGVCPVTSICTTRNTCATAGSAYGSNTGTASHGWQGPHDCLGDYCVYSNADVSKHEWAIFVTDTAAGRQLTTQSLLHRGIGSETGDDDFRVPFREAAILGKGRGVTATRAIDKGELILAEDPILLVHPDANNLPPFERTHLYDLILENLPPLARAEFLSQAGDDPASIAARNLFTVFGGDRPSRENPILYQGAFPRAARLNHDCRPNAAFYFEASKLRHITRAVRQIEPGEELTLTYTDLLAPRAERQRQLRMSLGFECKCKQCAMNETATAASDARLDRIIELCGILDTPSLEAIQEGVLQPDTGAQLVELFEEERLDAYMWYALRRAALNYAMFGHGKSTRIYAARALEALLREQGEEHPDVEDFMVLSTKPTKHWIWAQGRI